MLLYAATLGLCAGMAAYAVASGLLSRRPTPAPAVEAGLSVDDWHWPSEPVECVEYLAGLGDTLAAIAKRYYVDIDAQVVIWAIRRANETDIPAGLELEPGLRLLIPDPSVYGVGRPRAGR